MDVDLVVFAHSRPLGGSPAAANAVWTYAGYQARRQVRICAISLA